MWFFMYWLLHLLFHCFPMLAVFKGGADVHFWASSCVIHIFLESIIVFLQDHNIDLRMVNLSCVFKNTHKRALGSLFCHQRFSSQHGCSYFVSLVLVCFGNESTWYDICQHSIILLKFFLSIFRHTWARLTHMQKKVFPLHTFFSLT